MNICDVFTGRPKEDSERRSLRFQHAGALLITPTSEEPLQKIIGHLPKYRPPPWSVSTIHLEAHTGSPAPTGLGAATKTGGRVSCPTHLSS